MKLFDYTGVIHLHSSFSFDGSTPLEKILQSANKNKIDFLMLTDHDHLRARSEGWEGWHGNTLLIVGQEISPRFNHYLAFNIKKPISYLDDPKGTKPQKYIDAVNEQGGFGFIAHPDHEGTKMFHVKHYHWNDWTVQGYQGMGIWDFMTDWQKSLRGYFIGLFSFFFPVWFLHGPKSVTLQRWDALNQIHKTVGIGELDNHAGTEKIFGINFIVYPFDLAFKFVRTHVLTENELHGNSQSDIKNIVQALLYGRTYFALEYFREAHGFCFFIVQKDREYHMGDDFALAGQAELTVSLPAKASVRVIRNGSLWAQHQTENLALPISEAGIYRIEVYLKSYGKLRPWIFSNPLFIR
jgi:PHP domain